MTSLRRPGTDRWLRVHAPGRGLAAIARRPAPMSFERLQMPMGEAMFSQRSVRKFRPDPIPAADLRLIVEAAVKAPNGGNHQIGRFLVVTDRNKIRSFAKLYHEAWWAKRRDDHGWTGPQDVPPHEKSYHAAMG